MNSSVREETALALGHRLVLEGREKLTVTGVTDVERFDENAAILETVRGSLVLQGRELHVETLNLEAGEVRLTGSLDSLSYENREGPRESFVARLFR